MSKHFYKGEGGTLERDDPSYIARPVDQQLYELLQKGIYCFILNAHQMGKSSLMIRIIDKLKSKNQAKCVSIDMGTIDKKSEKNFYGSFIYNISEQLSLKNTINDQREDGQLPSTDSLIEFDYFLRKIALAQTQLPLVIFLDEIQSVFKSPFQERFFIYIRDCYNRRAKSKVYKRLTFCLLGTANPLDVSEKIKDTVDTEYNIGEILELSGFEKNEKTINIFKEGLDQQEIKPSDKLITIILDWTGGQPFLTQRICQFVVEDKSRTNEIYDSKEYIKGLIENKIRTDTKMQEFFSGIKSVLNSHSQSIRLLEIYKNILQDKETDFWTEYEEKQLGIIGLLTKNKNGLVPFNKIYSEYVFDIEWVEKTLQNLKPYSIDLANWIDSPIEYKDNFLLYGDERIDKADNFRKRLIYEEIDHIYIDESIKFWDRVKGLIPEKINRVLIIERIRFWTRGKKNLYYFIYNVINFDLENNNLRLDRIIDNEQRWIDNLVQDHLVKPVVEALHQSTIGEALLDTAVRSDIEKIKNRLLNNPNIDSFWLLLSYRQILRFEEISFNHSIEHQELLNIPLVIKDNKIVKIICQFYKEVFNQSWIEEKILEPTATNRPYAQKLVDWVDQGSQFTNESKLLQSEELETALNWIQIQHKKKLRDEEYQFILTSIVWEVWNSANDVTKDRAVTIIKKDRDKLEEKTSDYYPLLQEILRWTEAQPILLEKLLELVSDNSTHITADVGKWLENIVQSQVINDWKSSIIAEHLKEKSQYLIDPASYPSRLNTYAAILYGEDTANIIDTINIEFLSKIGIFINKNDNLLISNPIYTRIFNEDWINQQIDSSQKENINQAVSKIMDPIENVLNQIVQDWNSELDGIFIIELEEGFVLKGSSITKEINPDLYTQCYGDDGIGAAFTDFAKLPLLEAIENFSRDTSSGDLKCLIFMLEERILLSYLMPYGQEQLPVIICYICKPKVPVGGGYRAFRNTIKKIQAVVPQ